MEYLVACDFHLSPPFPGSPSPIGGADCTASAHYLNSPPQGHFLTPRNDSHQMTGIASVVLRCRRDVELLCGNHDRVSFMQQWKIFRRLLRVDVCLARRHSQF